MTKKRRELLQLTSANIEQKLLLLSQKISLTVAKAETIDAIFAELLSHICHLMNWPIGHIYVWSEAFDALVSSGVWYMADAKATLSFRKCSEATQFRQGEGTLGEVLKTGKGIAILNVPDSAFFKREIPIASVDIYAYFAFPVISGGKVTAVLEFFSPETEALDEEIGAFINHLCNLLSVAIEQQRLLDRLRQSETQLAEAQRTARMAYWEWDIINDRVIWSDELYRIFDLAPNSFGNTYDGYLAFVHLDDLAYVQEKVKDAYELGRGFDYFHRIIRPDGSMRVVHARGRPQYDQGGNIIKLHGTVQDMTEQRESELKLAKMVRQMSALMEIGQTISSTLDLSTIYEQLLTLIQPLLGADVVVLFLDQDEQFEVMTLGQADVSTIRGLQIPLWQSGLAGEARRREESLFVTGDECVYQVAPKLQAHGYKPRAMLTVPIRWQTEIVGVLEAMHHEEDKFDEDDLRLLEVAATWAAIASINAHQYEILQRHVNENELLAIICNAFTETLDLDKVLQLIVSQVQTVVAKADWTNIYLHQPESAQLGLVAQAGLRNDVETHIIDLGEGIVSDLMAKGGVVNVNKMSDDWSHVVAQFNGQAKALLLAPVESGRRRIGVIAVQSETSNAFTSDDERLLKTIGVQAGIAIENARLYAAQNKARQTAEKQRQRMQHMAQQVVKAQEEERARIARELHDESGQALTALKISLDLIRSMLPDEMTDVKESLSDVLALADDTMSNLRLLSHNLRPPGLDAYGLDAALGGLCQDFETHTRLQVIYKGKALPHLAALPALSLYRFAQEALTNIAKHAEATIVEITLWADSDEIVLTVLDDGQGFVVPNLEESVPAQGAGLIGMIERLEMVDGSLSIESSGGKGSRLTAVVPYRREVS